MAKIKYDVLLSTVNLPISAGENVELIHPLDGGHDQFTVKWLSPKNDSYTGTLPSIALEFTEEEILDQNLQVDLDGLPLFRNLKVQYIGISNGALSTDDILIVQEPWYNSAQMECQCINTVGKPNSNNRVVVKTSLLKRC